MGIVTWRSVEAIGGGKEGERVTAVEEREWEWSEEESERNWKSPSSRSAHLLAAHFTEALPPPEWLSRRGLMRGNVKSERLWRPVVVWLNIVVVGMRIFRRSQVERLLLLLLLLLQ